MTPRAALALALVVVRAGFASAGEAPASLGYFPLSVGNWWAYEELDDQGKPVSRETWTVLDGSGAAGEFHLRSSAKRMDALGDVRRHWEEHEYLRAAKDGVHKRYPAGRDRAMDVMLLREPTRLGTRWHDAQGSCEITAERDSCVGPRGDLPKCLVVVCRLGEPAATVVTSTYARGVGMVRQDIEVLQLLPSLGGSPTLLSESPANAHSILRLTGYHVARVGPQLR